MVVNSDPEVIACTAIGVGMPEVKGICCRCGVTLAAIQRQVERMR